MMERPSRDSGKSVFINSSGDEWRSHSPRVALAQVQVLCWVASLAQGFISGGCCASSLGLGAGAVMNLA